MTHLTIYNPHYGPKGEPYTVVIKSGAGTIEVPCWTEAEAWEVRDAAIDDGHTVRILGLPTRLCAIFPKEDDRLEIDD